MQNESRESSVLDPLSSILDPLLSTVEPSFGFSGFVNSDFGGGRLSHLQMILNNR